MRGAGKSTLGHRLADALNYRFLDLDAYLVSGPLQHVSIADYAAAHGWPAFRAIESEALCNIINKQRSHTVIATGGGVVESAEAREALRSCSLAVVWIDRTLTDIATALQSSPPGTRATLPTPIDHLFYQRRPWYRQAASHWFPVLSGSSLSVTTVEFVAFVQRVLGHTNLSPRPATAMLCLTLGDLSQAGPDGSLRAMTEDSDAVELRVDLLDDHDEEFVARQVALLRRYQDKPIVYTVRSNSQSGRKPQPESRHSAHSTPAVAITTSREYARLVRLGVMLGADAIDLEACWPADLLVELLSSCDHAMVIGSMHVSDRAPEVVDFLALCRTCAFDGRADLVKVVHAATDPQQCALVAEAAEAASLELGKPVMALLTGPAGRLSRVINPYLSPVTHPLLPTPAAPGQLTAAQVRQLRIDLCLTRPRKFFLFGSPIAHSPSPAMHTAMFSHQHLSHTYVAHPTTDAAEVERVLRQQGVGGASVTIPLKESLLSHLDGVSHAARLIGAVNTVTVECGRLTGDNTDWVGIAGSLAAAAAYRKCLTARDLAQQAVLAHMLDWRATLATASAKTEDSPRGVFQSALVIGAGGTARAAVYALQQLGCKYIYLFNRTRAKAARIAESLGGQVVDTLTLPHAVDVIVSTIPAAAATPIPVELLASK
jgi:pentafunctional AROM polypeptide